MGYMLVVDANISIVKAVSGLDKVYINFIKHRQFVLRLAALLQVERILKRNWFIEKLASTTTSKGTYY